MKSKSGRHKDENTFRFRTFSERISAINVDVIHRVRHVNEESKEEISYFHQDFEKWDVLNLTEGYRAFKKDIKINLLVTLPQVIAHKEHIVETLLKYLRHKDPLYLQPLLSLTATLAKDLRENFYEHYHQFYDILIELLDTKDTDQLEWVFQCLACFFHKLWKCFVKDFKKIFHSILPLLSENKPEYINNFAAESFTFVTRKVKDRKSLLDLILKTVNRKKDAIRGCGRLFFEVVKGVNGQLHSCAAEFLPLLFEILPEYEEFFFEILEYTVSHITEYISPSKSEIFWTSILTALDQSTENWNKHKDEKYLTSIENLLKLLGQAIEYKQGKTVCNLNSIVQGIVRILCQEGLPENVMQTLMKVVIVILLSNNIRLSQEDAAVLVKHTLAVKNKVNLLYFIDNITEFSLFEPLILPYFLKICEESSFEKDHFRVLTNVVMKKAPLTNSGITIKNWSKYPLKFGFNDEKLENSLLETVEEGLQDKERLFCTLVCIPHLVMKNNEKVKEALSNGILRLLKNCAKDQKETYFFLNLHMECLIHLNHAEFFVQHFQEIINILLPLVDEKSVLFVLKMISLLVVAVEGEEMINIQTLRLLHQYLEHYFCSPFHEVRHLVTFIYTLFEDIPEFDLIHSTDPDVVKEKFSAFTICHSIESVEPQISTYHGQINNLDKLAFEKPQMLMCHQTDFKLIPLRYICGVLYMNFQLLWQHSLNIIETHAHGLDSSMFWDVYGEQLKRVDHFVKDNLVLVVDSMDADYCTMTEFFEEWQKSESKPDYANYRLLLWKGLSAFADIAEAKTKDVSVLLLNFYENEFTKFNAELAYTWNIKQKDAEAEETLDPDPDDDPENDEPVAKSQPNQLAKLNGKKKLKTFLQYLMVFSKIKSPQSMYREAELYKLYNSLLQNKNSEIQKAALDCLMTYKKNFLTPYKENLYNLVDDKNFKNELATFNLDREGSNVVEEHREKLMEVVLRIVYGKMNVKMGMRTGGKSAGQHRRTLVIRFLGGCHEKEKLIFIRMIFKFFDRYLTEDFENLTKSVDLEHFIPPKRLQSAMNMLNVILEQFGDSLANELLTNLLHYIFVIGSFIKGAFQQISSVHIGYQSSLRVLRTAATKLVHSFFQKFQNYFWNETEIDNVFDLFVWPYLSKFSTEGIHSPTALLKLFAFWGSDPKYFSFLVKYKDDDKKEYVLPKVMELLVNDKSHATVVQTIMEMVQHLLIYVEDVNKVPICINNVLEVDQKVRERGDLNYGSCILLPHVPSVLRRIQKSLEKKSKNLSKLELFVLSRISELVWEDEISQYTLTLLLPVVLKKCHSNIPEDTANQYLTTVKNLLLNIEDPVLFLDKISLLYGEVAYSSGRKILQAIIDIIVNKSNDPELVLLKSITEEMNAYNARWLDQPDFERRHNAFKTIHSLLEEEKIELRLGVLLIYNSYYFLNTEPDLSIKENSSHLLKTLCPYLLKKYQTSKKNNEYLLETMFNLIRKGMKNKNDDLRNECISLLGHMARKCPDNHFILRDLHLFTNQNDPEVDFFENLIHLQVHRHGKAMTKLCHVLRELEVTLNVQTLTRFVLPLVSHYLLNEKYAAKHTLIDTAIETVGLLCRILPWHHYEGLLKFYLSKLRSRIVYQKQLVRLTVALLNSFHFDLSKAHTSLETNKVEKDNEQENKDNEQENIEEETKRDETLENDEEAVEEDIGEVLESVEEDLEEDEDDVSEEKKIKICEKITVLCKSTATRVVKIIRSVLLPQLHRALAEMTHKDSSHKLNRKLTRNEQEDEDLIKVPLSLAVVKLLQKLPSKILERNLPGVFVKTCTFLKSHLESVRKVARETLQEMMLTLGPSYLSLLLGEMAPLLQKGYQAHVLVYTVHGVLNCLKKLYQPMDIDKILLTVLQLCNTDLFGLLSEEKEVNKIAAKTSEAKSSKSLSLYQILAQFITEKCLMDLILPTKNILESSTSFKTVLKAQECLNSIAIGLVDNEFISATSLVKFAYGIASEKITQLIPGKEKPELTEKEKLLLQRQKPDCYIIPKAPVGRSGVRISKVKNSDKANAHHLVGFGLTLCHKLLKKDILVKQEHLPFLDPFVVLFNDCLKSKHIKLSTITLKCLTFIFKLELPSLKDHIKEITSDMFSILHKYAVAGLSKGENFDLVVVSFKAMSVLLRDVKYHIIDQDQLKILLSYVEKDIYDYDRQAVAFNLLRAILVRKLIVSELNEIMSKVAELSITSEMNHVRNQAREVFYKYLMDYPLGKELEKHVSFYLSQTSFELQYGRESALEMLRTLINGFPVKELNSYSGTILVILGARLVNEEVPQLRKTVATCLTSMLERLPVADRQPLFDIVILWFSDKNMNHRRLAAQLCGIFVNMEKATFESRLSVIIPLIMKQFGIDNSPGRFVKPIDPNEDTSDNEEKIRIKDHFYFQLLQLVLKICKQCPNFLKDKETINNFASHCQRLLNYPHDWVRLAACQFIGFVLSSIDIEHLSNLLLKNEQDDSGYLTNDPHNSLKSLSLDLCDQLQPGDLKSDLAEQVIKNLVFIARVLQDIPINDESESKKINLLWLCKRLRKSVNMEVVQSPSSVIIRTEVFKWVAAITTVLEVNKILSILHHLMAPLVREMLMTGEKNTFLRQLSKEVGNKIKKKVGLEVYTETLSKLQQTLSVKRAERKRSRNQLAVVDPESHAKKKIRKQEKKKESKKRKMEDLKGKKNFKRRKTVDLEEF